ncbi:MAG TPA: cytochrome c oxidase assembly protein [Solirubrobacteraceae bacterium]|nr:cytochrome c oxidase assembly protein [Solirubrobacteraceae bacterium]
MAAATRVGWSLDPALLIVLAVAGLYSLGDRRTVTPAGSRGAQRVRSICFYASLAVIAIALDSPLEGLSAKLFWVHMIQHVLLIAVAPPLLVYARPWPRLVRGVSLGPRRTLARAVVVGAPLRPVRSAARALGRPLPSFVAFSGVLVAWHIPALFDATLRSGLLHALEHSLFFSTALLFWKNAIHSPPLRAPLSEPWRAAYVVGAMVVTWMLAVVLALEPHAIYAPYVHEASRPGGISALADQQLAAGVMWVPGSIAFLIVLFGQVHRWLTPAAPRPPRLAGGHQH